MAYLVSVELLYGKKALLATHAAIQPLVGVAAEVKIILDDV